MIQGELTMAVSMSDNPTFEEVDRHIRSADLSVFQAGGQQRSAATAANPAAAIPNVCGAYKIVKPILALVSNFPFIPQSWKTAVQGFMGVLNTLCP
jgi:hypothetical protein